MPMLVQAGIAAAAGAIHWVSQRSPNPPPADDDRAKAKSDRIMRDGVSFRILKCRRMLSVTSAYAQAIAFATNMTKTSDSLPTWIKWTYAGYALVLAGGGLRVWCYRTLSHFFTFEIAVQKDHKIVQNGPYKYLAHPSYTGVLIETIGSALSLYGPFNILLASVSTEPATFLPELAGRAMTKQEVAQLASIFLSITNIMLSCRFTAMRIPDEEQMMRENFGEEYDSFLAKRWRLVPFLF